MQHSLINQLHQALKGKSHIIWDWNGTLLSDVEAAVHTVNHLLDDHSLPRIDSEKYRKIFEFPVINYYRALGFDFEKESFESLCHRFVDRFMAGVKELPLFPEMRAVLFKLHEEGMTQSVLSATDQDNLDSMISHFDLLEVFRFVYGINNRLAGSKLDRGHEVIRNSKIPKEQTVIIGDTLHDLEVAQALGVEAVLISHGHQCPTRLRPHHQVVI